MTATAHHRVPVRLAVRLAPALVAVAVLPLGGLLDAGSASASDEPVVGTSACSSAVERSPSVQHAADALDRAQGAADAAASRLRTASSELAAAKTALDGVHPGEPGYAGARERYAEAQGAAARATDQQRSADAALSPAASALAQARVAAQGLLCRPAGGDPTPLPPGNPGLPHHPVGDPCSEVRQDEKAVDSAQTDANRAHREADHAAAVLRDDLDHHAPPPVILRDQQQVAATGDAARRADETLDHAHDVLQWALAQARDAGAPCGSDQDPGDGSDGGGSTVDPVGDDGSSAAISGSEVTVVPVGSAQTGEA